MMHQMADAITDAISNALHTLADESKHPFPQDVGNVADFEALWHEPNKTNEEKAFLSQVWTKVVDIMNVVLEENDVPFGLYLRNVDNTELA